MKKKNIAILGSTGSIGKQALEVADQHRDIFKITAITANTNDQLLIEQAVKYLPGHVVIANKEKYERVKSALSHHPVKVHCGFKGIVDIVKFDELDMVLSALVGYSGLIPTVEAIRCGKDIALANKETLVVAGDLITELAKKHKVSIYPVDSEHSAIFQCITGEENNPIEKIYLTASGGPFRKKSMKELKNVTVDQALDHPNWCMGNKITIDSATLMNKGFEAIEAKWLFDLKIPQIDVIIHPQSIIHSIVQFEDGSMKAQMGIPDMRIPIQYALAYPERLKSDYPRFNFPDYPRLTFEEPDFERFRCLKLAYEAMELAGNIPCALNAANEIAVEAFLCGLIGFMKIPEIIEHTLEIINHIPSPSLDDYQETDRLSREIANQFIR